jgi:pilus assembly protein Flp/PilA
MVRAFFAREDGRGAEPGQGLVEYALILVLISVVVIGILTLLGQRVNIIFQRIFNGLGNGLG